MINIWYIYDTCLFNCQKLSQLSKMSKKEVKVVKNSQNLQNLLERVAKEFCFIRRSSFQASSKGDHRWNTKIKDYQQPRVPFSFWIFLRSPAPRYSWETLLDFSPPTLFQPWTNQRLIHIWGWCSWWHLWPEAWRRTHQFKVTALVGRQWDTYPNITPSVELSSSYWSFERLPSWSVNLSISLYVAWSEEFVITKSGVFRKNLKGIVAVHPIEVTDGDCWKVNFGLVTHICACYNGPLPKFNQNLDI